MQQNIGKDFEMSQAAGGVLINSEKKGKNCLKNRILEETDINSVGILGKTGYRVDAYGINKEIPNELYM